MPPCSSKRPRDVLRHHVDARDVQADVLAASTALGRHGRMDPLGHVDGRAARAQVGIAANEHHRAGRRHRVRRQPLIGQHGQGDCVELDLAQDRGVVLAAAGVGVDLIDQLRYRMSPVAQHLGRLAHGRPPPLGRPRPAAGNRGRGRTSRPAPRCFPAGRLRRPAPLARAWKDSWPRRAPGCRPAA